VKKPYYVTRIGTLERKGNTLFFVNEEMKRAIPINSTSEIHCFRPVSLTSGAIKILSEKNVPVHFYNKHGYYRGSYMPREGQISGTVVIKQAEHHLDPKKRLYIAKQFVEGIKASMVALLKSQGADYRAIKEIPVDGESPAELMGVESQLWREFYGLFGDLLRHFEFRERTRRPPRDEVNALISYGNSVLYTVALSEIRKTTFTRHKLPPRAPGKEILARPRYSRYLQADNRFQGHPQASEQEADTGGALQEGRWGSSERRRAENLHR